MNPVSETKQVDFPAVRRLGGECMREADRVLAKQQMRQAERAVDLIVALMRFVRSTAGQWKGRFFPSHRVRVRE